MEQGSRPESLKATQIPASALLHHLRLDPDYTDDADKATAQACYDAALAYVRERCGIDDEYMDAHPDIAIAVLALARNMYDNRSVQVDKSSTNRTVECVIAAHDHNLL